jgi:hypothetical protein
MKHKKKSTRLAATQSTLEERRVSPGKHQSMQSKMGKGLFLHWRQFAGFKRSPRNPSTTYSALWMPTFAGVVDHHQVLFVAVEPRTNPPIL